MRIRIVISAAAVLCALTSAANLRCVTPIARWGVPKELMPDGIHPSAAGYDIWMAALEPLLSKICR